MRHPGPTRRNPPAPAPPHPVGQRLDSRIGHRLDDAEQLDTALRRKDSEHIRQRHRGDTYPDVTIVERRQQGARTVVAAAQRHQHGVIEDVTEHCRLRDAAVTQTPLQDVRVPLRPRHSLGVTPRHCDTRTASCLRLLEECPAVSARRRILAHW